MSRQRTDLRPFNKKHVEPGRSISLPNARTSTSGSHLTDSGIRGFGIEMRHSLPSDKRTDGSSPVINTKIDNKESSDRTCELSLKKEVEKWKQKYHASQKTVNDLTAQLKAKDDTIASLEESLKTLELKYQKERKELKAELKAHDNCKKTIESLKALTDESGCKIEALETQFASAKSKFETDVKKLMAQHKEDLEQLQKEHEKEKATMKAEFERKESDLIKQHQLEIAEKDEKLKILKSQVAEALKGSSVHNFTFRRENAEFLHICNQQQSTLQPSVRPAPAQVTKAPMEENTSSECICTVVATCGYDILQLYEYEASECRERQNQIEELLRELKRVSDEAEAVKSALKSMKSSNKGECHNCKLYEQKCKMLEEQIKSKEMTIKDLFAVGAKMESQLSKQQEASRMRGKHCFFLPLASIGVFVQIFMLGLAILLDQAQIKTGS